MTSLRARCLALFGLSFLLLGCDPIRGSLTVIEEFDAVVGEANFCSDEDWLCQPENVRIPQGDYQMSLTAFSSRDAELKLVGDREYKMKLNINGRSSLPDNGPFRLPSRESGQPFNLAGQSKTDFSDTGIQQSYESCQITTNHRLCRRSPQDPRKEICETHRVVRQGQRRVEYFYRTTTTQMGGKLENSEGRAIGHFNGRRMKSDKIYTWRDICI